MREYAVSTPTIVASTANPALTAATAGALGTRPADCTVERFPDGEAHVRLREDVRDHDVYLLGSTGPPVDAHLMELALLADACWRADAGRITAVVPYFGYARQDRRSAAGEPVATRVAADVLQGAAIQRVIVVDPHTPAMEAMFGVPLESITAVPMLTDAVKDELAGPAVVVAPDLGAVKLAERVAVRLDLPTAVVRKSRLSDTAVQTSGLVGDIGDRVPLLVDDMISTAGTLEAAAEALRSAGCENDLVVAAVHGLFVGQAADRLATLPLQSLLVTDSLPVPDEVAGRCRVESLAGVLAAAIGRLHRGEPLGELASHG